MKNTKVTLYLDTRRKLKKGTYPIKFRIYHRGSERNIPSGDSCLKEHWIWGDPNNAEFSSALSKGEVKFISRKFKGAGKINMRIKYRFNLLDQFLTNNYVRFQSKSIDFVRDMVKAKLMNPDEELMPQREGQRSSSLIEGFAKKIKELEEGEKWGTRRVYKESLGVWIDFLEFRSMKDIELIDIEQSFLDGFVKYCGSSERGMAGDGQAKEGMKPNSISIRLRDLRHILNRAIKDKSELIRQEHYPFSDFKMPRNATAKRAIGPEFLDAMRGLELKKNTPIWNHRNYFLFLFNNQGMNLIDLAYLKRGQITNNRLEYARAKTRGKAVFDIELTEEALEILGMYGYSDMESQELVFPFIKDLYGKREAEYVFSTYKNRVKDHNKYLRKIAKMIGLEGNLTSYVARHTWASVGFEEFENIDVVGQALGHGSNPKVTKVYAKDLAKKRMDEVNKKVTKRGRRIAGSE